MNFVVLCEELFFSIHDWNSYNKCAMFQAKKKTKLPTKKKKLVTLSLKIELSSSEKKNGDGNRNAQGVSTHTIGTLS